MAKKSKTQRAKGISRVGSARRIVLRSRPRPQVEQVPRGGEVQEVALQKVVLHTEQQGKAEEIRKRQGKAKKKRFKFFKDVRAEMKRVTWPTRTDVLRWSGVVVVALLFFGVFVACS